MCHVTRDKSSRAAIRLRGSCNHRTASPRRPPPRRSTTTNKPSLLSHIFAPLAERLFLCYFILFSFYTHVNANCTFPFRIIEICIFFLFDFCSMFLCIFITRATRSHDVLKKIGPSLPPCLCFFFRIRRTYSFFSRRSFLDRPSGVLASSRSVPVTRFYYTLFTTFSPLLVPVEVNLTVTEKRFFFFPARTRDRPPETLPFHFLK